MKAKLSVILVDGYRVLKYLTFGNNAKEQATLIKHWTIKIMITIYQKMSTHIDTMATWQEIWLKLHVNLK